MGKIGVRSAGPAGSSVPGFSGGGASPGRSAIKLTQWVGMSGSSSRNLTRVSLIATSPSQVSLSLAVLQFTAVASARRVRPHDLRRYRPRA